MKVELLVQGNTEIAWVVVFLQAAYPINFEIEKLLSDECVASCKDCIGNLLYIEIHFPEVAVFADDS